MKTTYLRKYIFRFDYKSKYSSTFKYCCSNPKAKEAQNK